MAPPKLDLGPPPKLTNTPIPEPQTGRDNLLDAIRQFKKPLNKVNKDQQASKPGPGAKPKPQVPVNKQQSQQPQQIVQDRPQPNPGEQEEQRSEPKPVVPAGFKKRINMMIDCYYFSFVQYKI